MAIQRLQRATSAADRAADAVRREILAGRLAVGERLPPERELAASLGVSRLTLRAGLATLIRDGLVAVRHGSGSYVRDFLEGGGPELLGDLAEETTLAAVAPDLLRVRRHLAAAALEALAEHPPGPQRRRALARAIAALPEESTPDAFAPLDLAAARALVACTGSVALRLCLNPVMAVVAGSPPLRAAMYADPRGNVAGWRALMAWLDAPDPATIPAVLALLAERDGATLRRLRAPR